MNLNTNMKKFYLLTVLCAATLLFPSAVNYKKAAVIKLGFIPLTDCAPIVMAKEWNLFQKYGVEVEVSKEASWANVRDKILTGELDGAHCLFSMPLSVYTGIGGKEGSEMRIAMVLNVNGQAITVSNEFCGKANFKQMNKVGPTIAARIAAGNEVKVANTFPGGTHDIWMRNWLALAGVDQNSVKQITIPPPQMVSNMRVANMDAFCVGEPWNGVAVKTGIGFTQITTQDIWKDHPEKALVVNKQFADTRREELKSVMKAILHACKLLDVMSNRKKAAVVLGKQSYVNAPADVIDNRLAGIYDLGCNAGQEVYKDYMQFYKNGAVNMPRKSHAIWFMSQFVRFGYLDKAPDYKAIADKLVMQDLYREVAASMNIKVPEDDMKPFSLTLDKTVFDPNNPTDYLKLAKK